MLISKHIIFYFSLVLFFSCNNKKQGTNTSLAKQDTFTPTYITVLADLPDSLQPKITDLDTAPKPRTIKVPTSNGGSYSVILSNGKVSTINLEPPVTKLLPVLQNAKGEPIKDTAGNPFIMGAGGLSNFTTFTTDNGLALDAVSCSIIDKIGNIWFGTWGGGVSRFDGKTFTNYSTTQGLANNTVWSICEDRRGDLWFGTWGGGASRFDGKNFITFTTAQGLANNDVRSIAEDKTGILWFGTGGGGVSCYDPSASTKGPKIFTTFSTAQGLAYNDVRSITEDNAGNLWFGTWGGGVSRFGPSDSPGTGAKTFTTFSTAQGLANNIVWAIAKDKKGNLWFGTMGGGVSRYDGKTFTTFSTVQGLANNDVRDITEDKTGNLWFGTGGGGVSCYGPSASLSTGPKTFTTFSTAQGLAHNTVWSIAEDKTGNLWFGTGGAGVSRYDGKAFTTFSTTYGLPNNNVQTITEDNTGNLWFGTGGGGVSCYDGKTFTTFSTTQGLANDNIRSLAKDKNGNIWIGTGGGGVSRYDPSASLSTGPKTFTTFSTGQGLANNDVRSIIEDKKGNLWFGTWGGGVSRYDPLASSFTTFSTSQGLAKNYVRSIAEDKTGNIWIGTWGGGVSRYDGKTFINFTTSQGLAYNYVRSIAEDKTGNLWFGTAEGLSVMSANEVMKLNLTSPDSYQNSPKEGGNSRRAATPLIKTFTKTDGLPDNFVTQVLQLPNGKMAVGTNLGITLFIPSGDLTMLNGIEIYNSITGYPVKDVNAGQNCMFLDSKGVIWAGTGSAKTALVRFDPSELHTDNDSPTVIITGIKVNEASICWNDLSQNSKFKIQKLAGIDSMTIPAYITEEVTTLGKVLTEGERDSMKRDFAGIEFDGISRFYPVPEHLVLPYRFNHITIDFNAVETSKPGLVNYRYLMEGYDKEWSPVMKKTSADFGNIREGIYTFKVKAQGPNGVWCEPVNYTFKVLPPWYRTWWAYSIWAMLFLLVLSLFILWRERNLRSEKEKLETTVKKRTEALQKSNREKDRILSVVSHDLRSPVSAVAYISDMMLNDEEFMPVNESFNLIKSSSLNSLALIDELLGNSIDANQDLKKELADIVEVIKGAANILQCKAEEKKQLIQLSLPGHAVKIWMNKEKIYRVISNLLVNAIKFTNEVGIINIELKEGKGCVVIEVRDNGIGIPEDMLPQLFDMFSDAQRSGTTGEKSFGLGLSICKQIVDAHGGRIWVESEVGKGTVFFVELPVGAGTN